MKKFLIFTLVIANIISCSNNDDLPVIAACGVNNPVQELDWLKAEIERRKRNTTEDSQYCYIVQAMANEQTIFLYKDCNPLVNKIIPIKDCSGASAGFLGDENYPVERITMEEIIYRPADFNCRF